MAFCLLFVNWIFWGLNVSYAQTQHNRDQTKTHPGASFKADAEGWTSDMGWNPQWNLHDSCDSCEVPFFKLKGCSLKTSKYHLPHSFDNLSPFLWYSHFFLLRRVSFAALRIFLITYQEKAGPPNSHCWKIIICARVEAPYIGDGHATFNRESLSLVLKKNYGIGLMTIPYHTKAMGV